METLKKALINDNLYFDRLKEPIITWRLSSGRSSTLPSTMWRRTVSWIRQFSNWRWAMQIASNRVTARSCSMEGSIPWMISCGRWIDRCPIQLGAWCGPNYRWNRFNSSNRWSLILRTVFNVSWKLTATTPSATFWRTEVIKYPQSLNIHTWIIIFRFYQSYRKRDHPSQSLELFYREFIPPITAKHHTCVGLGFDLIQRVLALEHRYPGISAALFLSSCEEVKTCCRWSRLDWLVIQFPFFPLKGYW